MMMIIIRDLKESDKGRNVVFNDGKRPQEEGVINSWNDLYIFVRYGSDSYGKATQPRHIEFM